MVHNPRFHAFSIFFLDGVHLSFPIEVIESSLFSFCLLHRLHNLLLSKLCSPSINGDLWRRSADNVLVEVPTWLHRQKNSYVLSLSALSVPELKVVASSLHLTNQHCKSDFVEILLADFLEQRSYLWDIVKTSPYPCAVSVSRHFFNRYQSTVFHALCDLRTLNQFTRDNSFPDLNKQQSSSLDMWLYGSLDGLDSRVRQLSKQEILHSLHLIPSHLRPQYSTHSLCACRTPLLLHIHCRILYLLSLSCHSFFFFDFTFSYKSVFK